MLVRVDKEWNPELIIYSCRLNREVQFEVQVTTGTWWRHKDVTTETLLL